MLCKQWSPARAVDHIPLCPVHEAPCRSLEHVVSFRRHPIARRCDVSLLREPYVVLPLDKGANWAQRRSTTRRSPHRASERGSPAAHLHLLSALPYTRLRETPHGIGLRALTTPPRIYSVLQYSLPTSTGNGYPHSASQFLDKPCI